MAEETGSWLQGYLLATIWQGAALDFELQARQQALGDSLQENFNQAYLDVSGEARFINRN